MWGGVRVERILHPPARAPSRRVPGPRPSPREQRAGRSGPPRARAVPGPGVRGGPAEPAPPRPASWPPQLQVTDAGVENAELSRDPDPGSDASMASGGQHAPQNSDSEVRSFRCPGKSWDESLGEMALRCPLPPRPWNVSLSAAIQKSFSEACLRDALRLRAPSWTRSVRGGMLARPAAGPDPAAARGPPAAPSTQPPVPSPPRLMQKTWGGFPDQRRLLAYLTQAQGREARLWRGGQLQVPVPSRGPPGSTVIPLPHARTGRGRVPRAPATR